MAELWVLMTDLYGHKWSSSHGERDENGNWGKALSGITGRQMAEAARALTVSGDAWPPSAPEFRALCEGNNSGLGIPDVYRAWTEACEASTDPTKFKFSHPIVQECGRLTDWYSIRGGVPTAETVQRRFEKRYADLAGKMRRGESLVDGQLLIAHEEAASQFEAADVAADAEVQARIAKQGLAAKTSEQLRAEMRAKLGIKR